MKALFRYRFIDNVKSLAALAAVLLLIPIISCVFSGEATFSNAISITTTIWALVIGIIVLRGDLRLGNQFGVSRQRSFLGSVLSCTASYAVGSFALSAMTAFFQFITQGTKLHFTDVYQYAYSDSSIYVMPASDYIKMAILGFALSLCFGFFGMLCSASFWRANKIGKWALGIGMGLLFTVGIPKLVYHMFPLVNQLMNLILSSVWILCAFLLGSAAICLLITWLLIRRAPILAAAK